MHIGAVQLQAAQFWFTTPVLYTNICDMHVSLVALNFKHAIFCLVLIATFPDTQVATTPYHSPVQLSLQSWAATAPILIFATTS